MVDLEEQQTNKILPVYLVNLIINRLKNEPIIEFNEYLEEIKKTMNKKQNTRTAEQIQSEFAQFL